MLFFDVFRKVGEDPRIDEGLERSKPCLGVYHQDLFKEGAERLVLDERAESLAGGDNSLSILSFDDFGGKVLVKVLLGVLAAL